MPVTKTTRECYEVRESSKSGSEWANITLNCWDNPPPTGSTRGMYYGGEIQIHSSFGSWANSWSACGTPFKEFLISLDFDYIFTKFMGTALDKFDGKACVWVMFQEILQKRRRNGMSKDEAKEAWELLDDISSLAECSEHGFGQAMMDVARDLGSRHPMYDSFADPCSWPRQTRYDYQAEGFWKQLWPIFIDALKAEIQQPEGVPA